jgi:ligand-binding sensor domain-containing protein
MTHNSKGLSRLADEQWSIFNSANSDPDGGGPLQGLLDNDAVSISVAPNGYVWVGSYGGGLYRYDWTSWYRWNYQNSPMYGVPGNHAYWAATAVLADSRGDIWISAFGSDSLLLMGVYDPNSPDSSWQLFHASDVGLFTNFIQVLRSHGNDIWVGRGDGLDKLNNGGTPFDILDDNWQVRISNNNITDMEIDPAGTLWLGAVNGLFFVPASADTAINIELPPTISGSVNSVASDGVGNIWVGTVAGLGVLRPNRQAPWQSSWQAIYTTSNSPILNNKINDLAIDIQTGRVYIATDGGLSIFDSGVLPPTADLSDMNVFPNPVILSNGDQRVEFKRVPSDGTLTIYTAAGDMVARFDLSQRNYWDLKNSRGERIAGGIYLFHVRSGDASGTGKFAVIK